MNINQAYFSSLFSQTFGIPPIQFLIRKRLSVSQQLLMNTNLSIKEIAIKCGFEDPLYFSRLFREKIGVSPNNYRLLFFNSPE